MSYLENQTREQTEATAMQSANLSITRCNINKINEDNRHFGETFADPLANEFTKLAEYFNEGFII